MANICLLSFYPAIKTRIRAAIHKRLIAELESPESAVPEAARTCLMLLVDTLSALRDRINRLDVEISARAKQDEGAQRLMSIQGVGPMIATAIQALAPPAGTFRSERDFTAWVGLTPKQNSTGGKARLGRTSRMGERTLRRLLSSHRRRLAAAKIARLSAT